MVRSALGERSRVGGARPAPDQVEDEPLGQEAAAGVERLHERLEPNHARHVDRVAVGMIAGPRMARQQAVGRERVGLDRGHAPFLEPALRECELHHSAAARSSRSLFPNPVAPRHGMVLARHLRTVALGVSTVMLAGLCLPAMASAQAQPSDSQRTAPAGNPRPQSSDRPASSNVYFPNCDAARAAGAAPLYRGEPGYRPPLDRDGDGIACEPYRRRR